MPIHKIILLIAFMIVGTTFSVATFFVQHRKVPEVNESTYPTAIEYAAEMGSICPTTVELLSKKGSPSIECACPIDYSMDTEIVGYEHCYGTAECPILISRCIPSTQTDSNTNTAP